jgi:hypothetical protein
MLLKLTCLMFLFDFNWVCDLFSYSPGCNVTHAMLWAEELEKGQKLIWIRDKLSQCMENLALINTNAMGIGIDAFGGTPSLC